MKFPPSNKGTLGSTRQLVCAFQSRWGSRLCERNREAAPGIGRLCGGHSSPFRDSPGVLPCRLFSNHNGQLAGLQARCVQRITALIHIYLSFFSSENRRGRDKIFDFPLPFSFFISQGLQASFSRTINSRFWCFKENCSQYQIFIWLPDQCWIEVKAPRHRQHVVRYFSFSPFFVE